MLTLNQLKAIEPHSIIATGTVINDPKDVFMTNSEIGREMIWVAKRGYIHDWAIYITWKTNGLDYCISNGDKLFNPNVIRRLVPCDDEAFKMYRF